jgi:phosphoribosylformylglycinamidine cyclo-ligase
LSTPAKESLSYRDAGVDIDAGDALVEAIKPYARRTMRPEVLAGIGGFGALVEISHNYREPVLVAGTDGVGTKLKLAFHLHRHDTVGIDLVAMSVNDVLVQGAEPLFFSTTACGKLDVATATDVIKGMRAAATGGCALVGGETAEMPGMYPAGGTILPVCRRRGEKSAIIDGSAIAGDAVLGLASSGAHSNGYSLIRAIIERVQPDLEAEFTSLVADGGEVAPEALQGALQGRTLAQVLREPTRIYVKPLLALMQQIKVKGLAHITGGGLVENIPRALPERVAAVLQKSAWPMPPLFDWLQRHGGIADAEMHRVFNCGIGMTLIVGEADAAATMRMLTEAGENVYRIGRIEARAPGQARTVVV